jgi:flagellar L-ring protein precursor FlgH
MIRTASTLVLGVAGAAGAQSLYLAPVTMIDPNLQPMHPELMAISMIAVLPPEPREFHKHDLITIIIDENTLQKAEQTLETEKKFNGNAQINALLDIQKLLELQLEQGGIDGLTLYDLIANNKFDGEGEYERKDRFQGRITAEVIDVKPNGTLAVEARSTVDSDGEVISIIASGVCRADDVTEENTILSTQLANKMLVTRHEGEVRKSARKGIITRAFETLFAF